MVKGKQPKQPVRFLPLFSRNHNVNNNNSNDGESKKKNIKQQQEALKSKTINTTLAQLQLQQRQHQQQYQHKNVAHELYGGAGAGGRRGIHMNDDNDDDDNDDEEYGYSLEIYGSDCGESVSTLNDSCFGGASITGGYNNYPFSPTSEAAAAVAAASREQQQQPLSSSIPSPTVTNPNSTSIFKAQQHQQQTVSPMKQATSLVVGVVPSVPSYNTSFDTEDISYFVHDIMETTPQKEKQLLGEGISMNEEEEEQENDDDMNNSRINQVNGRLRAITPILTGTVSPKEKYLKKIMKKKLQNNSMTNNVDLHPNKYTSSSSSGKIFQQQKQPQPEQLLKQQTILISETTSTESHRYDDDDDEENDCELRIVEASNPSKATTTTNNVKDENEHNSQRSRSSSCCCCCCFTSLSKKCCPIWYHHAPAWIQGIICFGTCLLLVSIIVVIVGISLLLFSHFGSHNNDTNSQHYTSSNNNSGNSNSTIDTNIPNNLFVSAPTTTPLVIPTISTFAPSVSITASPVTTAGPTKQQSKTANAPTTTTPVISVPPRTIEPTQIKDFVQQEGDVSSSSIEIYITGGRYSDNIRTNALTSIMNIPLMTSDISNNDPNTFMIHLGDWSTIVDGGTDSSPTLCTMESSYQSISDLFSLSSIPVYFIMGENESTGCNDPTTSVSLWKKYLIDFETRFWSSKSWDINEHQSDSFSMYNENRLFSYNQIAYVTLNVVTEKESTVELTLRHEANLEWIDTVYTKSTDPQSSTKIRTIIIFVNDGPDSSIHNTPFYTELFSRIQTIYTLCHFIIVSRTTNESITTNSYQEQYNNISNLGIVSIVTPIWPPIRMTVNVTAADNNNNMNNTVSTTVPQITLNDDSW